METLKFHGRNILDGLEQRSEGSSISRVNSSEVKQSSERIQRYHFSVTYVMEVIFSDLY